MKITQILNKYYPKNKYTDRERLIIFKAELPLRLRNTVSMKTQGSVQKHCMQEMSEMMACLKNSEFEESECTKEIRKFQDCCKTTLGKVDESVSFEEKKDLNVHEMNKYLQKFPQEYKF